MSATRVKWPVLAVAFLCLLVAAAGGALLLSGNEGSQALGWALLGFFGSGVVVLGRRALATR